MHDINYVWFQTYTFILVLILSYNYQKVFYLYEMKHLHLKAVFIKFKLHFFLTKKKSLVKKDSMWRSEELVYMLNFLLNDKWTNANNTTTEVHHKLVWNVINDHFVK